MLNIEKQIRKLYASSVLGNLSLTGAWVAILAARGYNLVDIGIAETVFHITSLIFEIPSGVLADVFGRKKMLIVSSIMRMIGNIIMILSDNLFTVCLSIAFHALSYNFSSGTGDALAYDSLKAANAESRFERFESDQLVIYRLCSGISTLCAGFALFIGHRLAYGTDLITGVIQIAVLMSLSEMYAPAPEQSGSIAARLAICLKESFTFMKSAKRAMKLMIVNSLIGAADTLLLFFLQAKLPERGYRCVFCISSVMVLAGIVAEHSPMYAVMALGGFIAAVADDALQVRTNVLLQDMFPSEQRATLTSLESFTFSVIMIVLSPLAGFAFTYW